jgi:hypothetical protein
MKRQKRIERKRNKKDTHREERTIIESEKKDRNRQAKHYFEKMNEINN